MVGQAASGGRPNSRRHVVADRVHGVGGAEAESGLPLVGLRIHGQDRFGPGDPGRLDGAHAHSATPDHDDRVAPAHPGRVGDRPGPGQDTAPQ